MAMLLRGAPAAAALDEETAARAAALLARGVTPTLAILRVGARDDDLSYERGAAKRCAKVGIAVKTAALPEDVESEMFFDALAALNADSAVHGILLLRPLPKQIDGERARNAVAPEKDVDGCTDASLAGVFTGAETGFPPCTARAAVVLLEHYGIPIEGRRVTVVGRSLVVGRPAALLLLHKNATVTLCHTKTADLPAAAREADILLACTGQAESLGRDCFRPGQTVIDAGIHYDERTGRFRGDAETAAAEAVADAVTPVPGGLGAVTTSVLAAHVAQAAERSLR